MLLSVIRHANTSADAICPIYNALVFVRLLLFSQNKYWRCGSAPSFQGKVGKASFDWFGYAIIDKEDSRVREMCTKWITKGNWPKFEEIQLRIFQINSEYTGLEADQCIDIILSDFQVLKYFFINNLKGSKLDLALKNKKMRWLMIWK